MPELRAQRTLVKSPPELWAQLSDPASLSRHLGEFGEIRITRVVPEQTVAWEGERASGTVELSASGWGTKVTLRARLTDEAASTAEPQPAGAEAEPAAAEAEPAASETPPSESRPADAFELINSLAREPLPQTPETVGEGEPEADVGVADEAAPVEPRESPYEQYAHLNPANEHIEVPDESAELEPEQDHGPELDAWFAQSPDPADETHDQPGWPKPSTVAGAAHQRQGLFARLFGRRQAAPHGPEPTRPRSEYETEPTSEYENYMSAGPVYEQDVAPMIGAEAEPAHDVAEPEQYLDPEPELEPVAIEPTAELQPEVEPLPEPAPPSAPADVVASTDSAEPEPAHEPTTSDGDPVDAPLDAARAEAVLTAVLDDLGAARHRPFSRG